MLWLLYFFSGYTTNSLAVIVLKTFSLFVFLKAFIYFLYFLFALFLKDFFINRISFPYNFGFIDSRTCSFLFSYGFFLMFSYFFRFCFVVFIHILFFWSSLIVVNNCQTYARIASKSRTEVQLKRKHNKRTSQPAS